MEERNQKNSLNCFEKSPLYPFQRGYGRMNAKILDEKGELLSSGLYPI
jgi:hypothetical protein